MKEMYFLDEYICVVLFNFFKFFCWIQCFANVSLHDPRKPSSSAAIGHHSTPCVLSLGVTSSVCFGGLSSKYLLRGFFYRPGSQAGDFSRYWPFHAKTLQLFSGSFPHKALLSSLSRSDVFVHTSPARQKKGEILFTSAFDIHLLFLQSFQGALFAQWNRLCLEEAAQWRSP